MPSKSSNQEDAILGLQQSKNPSVRNLSQIRLSRSIQYLLWIFAVIELLRICNNWFGGVKFQSKFTRFEQCSIDNFLPKGKSIVASVSAIAADEFATRRDRLAEALVVDGVEAFVVEPGYTFKYYANVSQTDWEPWEPEERPFLMIVQAMRDNSGTIRANTTFLAPKFEAERVRMLGMPFETALQIVVWEEHWSPYKTLLEANLFLDSSAKLMVDEEMRDFIQRGLMSVGFDTVGYGGSIEKVRQTKSKNEVEILKAVNSATVEAIREMRKCLVPSLTENEVQEGLDSTLRAAGLEPFFDIVLFDEDASNPHGGTDGSKTLRDDTFVLIDVGAHLYGYSSDVTRTFLPPFMPKNRETERRLQKKIDVWNIVLEAQSQSIHQFRDGNTAASVDLAARRVIEKAGYGEAFTHRVGHGIGIKAHESPYLNKGNSATMLRAGMTFTSEPGIYLVDEFGVRHEDVFLVTDGSAECLSCPRAIDPWTP